jgi:hypothetical protein
MNRGVNMGVNMGLRGCMHTLTLHTLHTLYTIYTLYTLHTLYTLCILHTLHTLHTYLAACRPVLPPPAPSRCVGLIQMFTIGRGG